MDDLITLVLATGALGTSAFGIVEALKWTAIGTAGFKSLKKMLGPVWDSLTKAYGNQFETVMKAQYRGDQKELARMVRQGARVSLTPENATEMADFLSVVDSEDLKKAADFVQSGEEIEDEGEKKEDAEKARLRLVLGRFELALDGRIEAALTLARSRYIGWTRGAATTIALSVAFGVGLYLSNGEILSGKMLKAMLIGLAAVPLAPVAKDLSKALRQARTAIGVKR